jgi:hypothetical protein
MNCSSRIAQLRWHWLLQNVRRYSRKCTNNENISGQRPGFQPDKGNSAAGHGHCKVSRSIALVLTVQCVFWRISVDNIRASSKARRSLCQPASNDLVFGKICLDLPVAHIMLGIDEPSMWYCNAITCDGFFVCMECQSNPRLTRFEVSRTPRQAVWLDSYNLDMTFSQLHAYYRAELPLSDRTCTNCAV